MKLYFVPLMLIFKFLGLLACYADEICPHNEEILKYEDNLMKLDIDNSNKLLRYYTLVVFKELPLYCAEKLVGQGVDRPLLIAGFPELITSITPDIL